MSIKSTTEALQGQLFGATLPLSSDETREDMTFQSKNKPVERDPIYTTVQTSSVRPQPSLYHGIPLIDLEEIDQARGQRRKELIDTFGNDLRNIGCIAVKVEHLTECIEEMDKELEGYFSQPMEVKMQDRRENPEVGYSEPGREALGIKQRGSKETYCVLSNHKDWPEGRDGFKKSVQSYRAVCEKVLESLGCTTEDLHESIESTSTGRKLHILRLQHDTNPWAGAHTEEFFP